MSPSEELRFDFEVIAEVSVPSKKRQKRSSSVSDPEALPSADDLLARIAKVQAVATGRASSSRLRTGSFERDDLADADEFAPNRHPSRGPSLASLADEIEPTVAEASEDTYDEIDGALEEEESDSLTIAEFYARVRQALRAEFEEEVWVTGEIRSIRESRGHHYLELGDHSPDQGGKQSSQQLQVVCWSRDWPGVSAVLSAAGVDLEVGRVVRVRGKVGVWDGASKLQFTLTALDIEALLGGIAQARRRLLEALDEEGLLRANARHLVSLVPLRIGIVTSPGTEAHHDFVGELERSGVAFSIKLEASLVQGGDAPGQIAAALKRLEAFAPDIAVVIRGGGARGDLSCFDSEEVARAIATAPFPVWTGIGHTGDRAVADEVAGMAFITPTACGEAIVTRVLSYWNDIERQIASSASLARAQLETQSHRVATARERLAVAARYQLERRERDVRHAAAHLGEVTTATVVDARIRLVTAAALLSRAGDRAVANGETALERRSQVLRAFDPRRQLARGWSLTRSISGRLIRSAADVDHDDVVVTRFADGEITSVVTVITPSNQEGNPN
jgi:exodeoxyribonuclease VII large subunit